MIPVINQRHTKMLPGDVYIGRPSPVGNPFVIGKDGNREQVIALYEEWIDMHPELIERLSDRQPRRLVCWCAPLACHGDVLARKLEEYERGRDVRSRPRRRGRPSS